MCKENIYQQKGYKNREDYLQSLSDEYGVDLYAVNSISDLLGKNEDFDGLINALESAEEIINNFQ